MTKVLYFPPAYLLLPPVLMDLPEAAAPSLVNAGTFAYPVPILVDRVLGVVTPAPVPTPTPSPTLTISGTPGTATVGTSATFTPAISGGTAPYTLSLASGTLPPGRVVNGSARTVTGTYTTDGKYIYVLRATDSVGATADLAINLTVAAAVAGYDVILLAGQSNMVSRSGPISATLDATDDRILQYGFDSQTITLASDPLDSQDEGADTVSMGLSLAKAYIADGKLAPNRKVLLVPVAKGDTGFTGGFWVAGGEGDVAAIARANAAMDQPGSNKLVMIAWHQGERDRFSNRLAYSSNIDELITRWRSSITGAAGVPFILGGLVAGGAQTAGDISVALEDTPNRVALTAFATSAGLSAGSDNTHFIASSLRTFGGRYYAAQASALANNAAPAAPAKVTGLVASSASGQAGLTWSLPSANRSAITDYIVEAKPSSGTTWTVVADGTSANTSATVTGLTNGTAYDFRVSAVNAIGTGSVSDPASATPAAPPSTGLLATYTAPDGTNLTAYTTDSGHSYTRTDGTMQIIGGRATATAVGADGVYSWEPQSIFQRIRARMIVNSKNGSHQIRYRFLDANNHCYFGLGSGGSSHSLACAITGQTGSMQGGGSITTPAVAVGDVLDYELTITGTVGDETHTLRLSQNGGPQVVLFTGKPTAIAMQTLANPGKIGHREFSSSSSATTGVQIDNLDAVAL
ncbi:hypothetical protein ASE70_17380 [Sphingomonas sp. Leaf22]|uniref:sialate O-acetylesterase n=1 Tax=Sphingomonas sp. Leaf22 TaxID=1735687 RepID=UPI0006FA52D6|nr:sialate O-acetylesterase [Sphingomonas sp. Leaf22]KQM86881.1 hypothetical protein ASE70_17380 [Sphingomonas sp. Leaf22]